MAAADEELNSIKETISAVEKKKARLCIQGFSQIPGLDYDNTFAPTGKFTSLLIVLTLSVDRKLPIRQFDVKSDFLFQQKKSLYGLKQARENWFETLTLWFESIKFNHSKADPCWVIWIISKNCSLNDFLICWLTIWTHYLEWTTQACRYQRMLVGQNSLVSEFEKLKINYWTHTRILNYLACRKRPDLALSYAESS
ncbi:hypothetical protein VP01_1063g3 [Puccinia sorghi]|uniref:Reverse transcriptase Ty1/copia-type domain-containing protein n=1 Tax=Puccinia sorghi TaxID=27349 RepID=A0A0L6VV77_9BASI|nr:hypothetical protein VP01_1063g3 [Puccinia sorghi]